MQAWSASLDCSRLVLILADTPGVAYVLFLFMISWKDAVNCIRTNT